MNDKRFRPQTIDDIGLVAWLDQTKDKHKGLGYDEFVKRLTLGVNKSNIARMFNVDRSTILRWAIAYEAEQENR